VFSGECRGSDDQVAGTALVPSAEVALLGGPSELHGMKERASRLLVRCCVSMQGLD